VDFFGEIGEEEEEEEGRVGSTRGTRWISSWKNQGAFEVSEETSRNNRRENFADDDSHNKMSLDEPTIEQRRVEGQLNPTLERREDKSQLTP